MGQSTRSKTGTWQTAGGHGPDLPRLTSGVGRRSARVDRPTGDGLRHVLIRQRQQGRRLWQCLPRQRVGRRRHAVAGQHAQDAMVEYGRTRHRTFVALCSALLVERRLWRALGGTHRHPRHGAALAPGLRTRDRGDQSRQQHRAHQPEAEPAQLGRSPGHGRISRNSTRQLNACASCRRHASWRVRRPCGRRP